MRELDRYINKLEERCPEGIKRMKKERKEELFIYGTKYTEKIKSELSGFGIKTGGVIAPNSDSSIKDGHGVLKEAVLRTEKHTISVIVGFSWSQNPTLLRQLCDDDFIRNIYIMEGAEYAWCLMFCHELKLFKHSKMIFVDSYYKGLIARGLDYSYFREHKAAFEETYHMLEDKLSRQTYLQYIEGHVDLKTFPMESVRDDSPQYFGKGIINLNLCDVTAREIFVDCGAYDGDTILEFNRQTSGKYGAIYAFEPDKKMLPRLRNNVKHIKHLNIYETGAYDQKGRVGFDSGGCGTIDARNIDDYIEVNALDNIIKGKVTFIKMDVEGAELAALMGAEKLIRTYSPKLAICVYHKAEDLIKIPQYLKRIVPGYKLYLRAYFDYCSEVVLYAVK